MLSKVRHNDRSREEDHRIWNPDEFSLANCVALVQNGLASPEDEECRAACNRTASEITAAKEAMDRLLNGKGLPEDEDDDEDEENEE